MVTISIALLIMLSALAGDRVLQIPAGVMLKHKAKAATTRVYRAVVPKKLKAAPKPKMDCREVEPNVTVCIATPVEAKEARS